MECPVCLLEWHSTDCVPLMLNCGHSFCKGCLMLMLPKAVKENNTLEISCPTCNLGIKLFQKEAKDEADKWLGHLVKNFALI